MSQPQSTASPLKTSPLEASYEAFTVAGDKKELLIQEEHHRVTLYTAIKLKRAAIVVSWMSTIIALAQGVFALVISYMQGSESLFGFALDAILDSFSSMVVLWRFYGAKDEIYSERREKIACAIIGVLFVACAGALIGKATHALVHMLKEELSQLMTILCITNGVISLILGISKIVIGYKLESRSLQADSFITLIGSAMSFITLGGILAVENNPSLWSLDSIFGIVFGAFLFFYGVVLIWKYILKDKLKRRECWAPAV